MQIFLFPVLGELLLLSLYLHIFTMWIFIKQFSNKLKRFDTLNVWLLDLEQARRDHED